MVEHLPKHLPDLPMDKKAAAFQSTFCQMTEREKVDFITYLEQHGI